MESAIEDAASTRRVTLDLSFKNQHHVLTLPASTPLLDIQVLADGKTGIAPAHQKLIHKGKTLTDPTITLGQLGGDTSIVKLVLIGTTAAALAALAEGPKLVGNVRIINDLGSTGGSGRGMVPILRSRRYGFQRVDVLPHLPEEERARRILLELASDPGVLHVMEKYQWSVGALCEMYPEGLVGVSSVCVMGTCLRLCFLNLLPAPFGKFPSRIARIPSHGLSSLPPSLPPQVSTKTKANASSSASEPTTCKAGARS